MLYKKTCPHCGTEFETPYENQRYCGHTCANRGRRLSEKGEFDHSLEWEKDAERKWMCPYAQNVGCRYRKCNKCGWNPEVAKARTEAYMEKHYGN